MAYNIKPKHCSWPNCSNFFKPTGTTEKYCGKPHAIFCNDCGSIAESSDTKNTRCKPCGNRNKTKVARETMRLNPKRCEWPNCHNFFKPVTGRSKYCSVPHQTLCRDCGVLTEAKGTDITYCKPCSNRNRLASVRKSMKEKYGVEYPLQNKTILEKTQESSLRKYGVKHPLQDEVIRKQTEETQLRRYGVKHALENKEIHEKTVESLEKNYGVRHPSLSPEIREKIVETTRKNYGVDFPYQSEEVMDRVRSTNLQNWGVEWTQQSPEVKQKTVETLMKKGGGGPISKLNKRWLEILQERYPNEEFVMEERLGSSSFIDIAVPSKNLYIDFNPTFTHNSNIHMLCVIKGCVLPCEKHQPTPKNHHFKRSVEAMENEANLVQIYDWDDKKSVFRMLDAKLESGWSKISARKLELKKLTQKEANSFLRENHPQGALKKQTYCYGLYKKDELISVATFGKSRFGAKEEFEWLRYATKHGYIIHGASSRFFQAFTQECAPKSVISYIDFNHTTGKTFMETCGFKEKKPTGPQLVWSKKKEKIYNNSLIRQGADRLLGTSYGRPEKCGMNNREIMLKEGWLPVYTAGNRVFVWCR